MRVSAAYSSVRQLVSIGGPAAGGALVALGTPIALDVSAAILALSAGGLVVLPLPARAVAPSGAAPTLGGLRFIRAQPVVLAAITLDLLAVLFGGATALLPADADTILRTGPVWG